MATITSEMWIASGTDLKDVCLGKDVRLVFVDVDRQGHNTYRRACRRAGATKNVFLGGAMAWGHVLCGPWVVMGLVGVRMVVLDFCTESLPPNIVVVGKF